MSAETTVRLPVTAPPQRLRGLMLGDGLAAHRERYGPLPALAGPHLIDLVEAAGLRGRGGAGFPTGRKLRTVAAGRRQPVVLANGCEGEPASAKDRTLLAFAPHLVLDGAVLAARAVGARRVLLCVHRGSPRVGVLARAIAQRADPVDWEVVEIPHRYVASEESALVRFVNQGEARPSEVPPRPFERGVDARPTLIDNVETLAQLALVAAQGADWFRQLGTPSDPGSTLVTLSGAVGRPGVYEMALGTPLRAVLDRAGRSGPVSAALVGGYFGAWVPLPAADGLPVSHDPAGSDQVSIGAGAIAALPATACGLAETARVFSYLAHESADQCGPCRFGLPAVAEQLRALAAGRLDATGYRHLTGRLAIIPGRGACRHPDGAIRMAASALRVFAEDARVHLRGRLCAGRGHPAVLPVPRPEHLARGWR